MKSVTYKDAIKLLNELHEIDPMAISILFGTSARTNQEMADHPTVQVGTKGRCGQYQLSLSFIGILNGLFGSDKNGNGRIAVMVDDKTDRVTGFCEFKKQEQVIEDDYLEHDIWDKE